MSVAEEMFAPAKPRLRGWRTRGLDVAAAVQSALIVTDVVVVCCDGVRPDDQVGPTSRAPDPASIYFSVLSYYSMLSLSSPRSG